MGIWFLLSILFFLLITWSIKGATVVEYYNRKKVEEYHPRVWIIIVIAILCCLPVINVLLFLIYWLFFIIMVAAKPAPWDSTLILELSETNKLHKMIVSCMNYLNRKL
jgi:hypothetical protein